MELHHCQWQRRVFYIFLRLNVMLLSTLTQRKLSRRYVFLEIFGKILEKYL